VFNLFGEMRVANPPVLTGATRSLRHRVPSRARRAAPEPLRDSLGESGKTICGPATDHSTSRAGPAPHTVSGVTPNQKEGRHTPSGVCVGKQGVLVITQAKKYRYVHRERQHGARHRCCPWVRPREAAPDLTVPLLRGSTYRLTDQRPPHFTMVVFFRDLRCPVCRAQLTELKRRLGELEQAGIDVIAVAAKLMSARPSSPRSGGSSVSR
jgi:hypothetical protein